MAFCKTTWSKDLTGAPGLKLLGAADARLQGFTPKHHRDVHPDHAAKIGLPARKARKEMRFVRTVTTSKLPAGFRPPARMDGVETGALAPTS
jgi:hypothetical protein